MLRLSLFSRHSPLATVLSSVPRAARPTPKLSFRAQRGIPLRSLLPQPTRSPAAAVLPAREAACRGAPFLECGGLPPLSPRFVGAGLAPPAPCASPPIRHSERSEESLLFLGTRHSPLPMRFRFAHPQISGSPHRTSQQACPRLLRPRQANSPRNEPSSFDSGLARPDAPRLR